MTLGLPRGRSPLRLGVRDEHGPTRRLGDVEVTPVARIYDAGVGGRAGGVSASLARPYRIEVRRDGVARGSLAVPDWNLRITLGALALVAAAWLIGRSRR